MIDRRHISNALGTRGLDAFDRKRRGGDADVQGDTFEAEFALAEILRLSQICRQYVRDPHDIFLAAQVEGFVDDLFVNNNGTKTYYELKSSPSQTWTKALRANFLRQLKILRLNRLKAKLVLVVSDAELAERMADSAQRGLRSVVVSSFRADWSRIRRSVRSFAGGLGTDDEITGLIHMLIGVWRGPHPLRSLADIVGEWRRNSGGRIGDMQSPCVSAELKDFFESVTDMTFEPDVMPVRFIHHDIFGQVIGEIPVVPGTSEWEALEERFLSSNARCYLEFRQVLIEFLEGQVN
ncbi:hypothetical protein [Rhizobium sp. CNPSo 3490]|uniref:hypothetical protein n=1 Tax=Rhizobium sp. CNPSo 3490 TaxID=3021407 RepID=UPI00254CC423|nr:hypothetical protein [Rhizobium sp. CNPSo 3490]MDK4733963.1 hypothetical protein [Rhizobium sp. CNPSo 3490]